MSFILPCVALSLPYISHAVSGEALGMSSSNLTKCPSFLQLGEKTTRFKHLENGSKFLARVPEISVHSAIDVVQREVPLFQSWLRYFGLPVTLCILGCWLTDSYQTGNTRADPLVGYRAFLVLTVFFYHTGLITYSDVGAFFMMSGTVLTLSRRQSAGQWKGPLEICKWILRRLLRIFPPYWFAQAVAQVLHHASDTESNPVRLCWKMIASFLAYPVTKPRWAFLLVGTTELNSFWFLQCIVCFYILFPACERIIVGPASLQTSRAVFMASLCALAKVGILLMAITHTDEGPQSWFYVDVPHFQTPVSLYASPLFRLPDFILGMCLPHLSGMAKYADALRVDIAAVALVVMPCLAGWSSAYLLNHNVQFPLHCIMLLGLSGEKQEGCSWTCQILTSRALLLLGNISYSFYLQQATVAGFMGIFTGGDPPIWQDDYCFQVLCGLLALLPVAWAAAEFAEHFIPSKCVQLMTEGYSVFMSTGATHI